ncbi:MAG: FtsX-like permease family protein, partial [Tannerella sp.]|jgi:putative ABC transport system permease protein|nr:FtsX-like permease family protein [Tannerella sp.]
LAFFILLLAVTNFINLFVTQGTMRLKEIGIRKTNGAQIKDIIRLFFSEVSVIVFIAFGTGLFIAIACLPSFSQLINKTIDLNSLASIPGAIAMILLFAVTVLLSAFYPAIYLSRFSPLDILGKRIRYSERRLTTIIVVFQTILSIVFLSVILVLFKQVYYLEKLPLGLNPENVMSVITNKKLSQSYHAVRQELLQLPEVKAVAGSDHIFGERWSGQIIANAEDKDNEKGINEYRMLTGMPEFMELEPVEGRFWQESDPDSVPTIILNQAAVKMLGGESLLGKTVLYNREPARVVGVVRDFFYDNPSLGIAPIVLTNRPYSINFNIRFRENVPPDRARQIISEVFRRFDPDFILNPIWCTDIYKAKFKEIKTLTRIVLIGAAISIFVAMLGLLAVHLFSIVRRTKEIGIRRIHGARKDSIFLLLSFDVLKWIGLAALFAIPAAVYVVSEMLNNYTNHTRLDWMVFALPVLIQCVIALITTSGVTVSVLSRNPVKSLKTE